MAISSQQRIATLDLEIHHSHVCGFEEALIFSHVTGGLSPPWPGARLTNWMVSPFAGPDANGTTAAWRAQKISVHQIVQPRIRVWICFVRGFKMLQVFWSRKWADDLGQNAPETLEIAKPPSCTVLRLHLRVRLGNLLCQVPFGHYAMEGPMSYPCYGIRLGEHQRDFC